MTPRVRPSYSLAELRTAFRPARNAVRFERELAAHSQARHALVFPYGRSTIYSCLGALDRDGGEVAQPAYNARGSTLAGLPLPADFLPRPDGLGVLSAMRATVMQLGRCPLGPCRHYAAAMLGAEGRGLGLLVVRPCAIPKVPTESQPLRKITYWIGCLLDEAVRRVYALWGGDLAVLFEKHGAA